MDADGRLVLKSLAVLAFATVLCCAPVRSDSSTEKIFESASAALRKGDYAAAEVGFRKVLQAEPRNIGAMSNLGVVYSRTLRYARAIEIYKRALRLSPREQGVLLNLGLVYLKQDDYGRAKPYFERLHRMDPKNAQAANLLATCLVYGGEPAGAFEVLKPLMEGTPDPATLYLLGVAYSRSGQAEKELRAALDQDGEDTSAIYFLGALYVQNGEYRKSVPLLEQAHKVIPDSWSAAYYLGKAKLKMNQARNAVPLLEEAAELNPDEPSVFYLLATGLKALGRNQEAKAALKRVSELHDTSLEAEKKALRDANVVGTR